MRKYKLILAFLLVAVVAGASIHLHFLSIGDNAKLVCNQDECLLFNSQSLKGYRYTPLTFAGHFVLALLSAPEFPTSEKEETVVIRITPKAIEKIWLPFSASVWGVYKGRIYGGGGDGPWKWNGSGTELISSQEQAEFDSGYSSHEVLSQGELNGWFAKDFNPTDEHTALVQGVGVIVVSRHDGQGRRLIEAQIGPNRSEVWRRDSGPRRISSAEYARIFGSTNFGPH